MEIRIRKIAILPHVRSNLARLIIHPLNQIKYPVNDKCSLDIYITTIYEFKKIGGGVCFSSCHYSYSMYGLFQINRRSVLCIYFITTYQFFVFHFYIDPNPRQIDVHI